MLIHIESMISLTFITTFKILTRDEETPVVTSVQPELWSLGFFTLRFGSKIFIPLVQLPHKKNCGYQDFLGQWRTWKDQSSLQFFNVSLADTQYRRKVGTHFRVLTNPLIKRGSRFRSFFGVFLKMKRLKRFTFYVTSNSRLGLQLLFGFFSFVSISRNKISFFCEVFFFQCFVVRSLVL